MYSDDDDVDLSRSSWSYGPVVAPRPATYVPAVRKVELPRWESAPIGTDAVWEPRTGQITEVGTPVSRATATVIRAAPLVALLLPITAAGAWALGAHLWEWILLFGLASVAAYLLMLWLDLLHNSPGSVERHRVNAAATLKRRELELSHELKRKALEAYLDHLEREQ